MESTTTTIPNTAGASDPATVGQQLLDALIAMEAIVPDLTPQNPREQRRVAVGAKFADALIVPTITTVTSSPLLKERKLFDVERGRAALQFRDEVGPVTQRLAAFVSALQFTIDRRLAEAGLEALQTYQWSKRTSKRSEGDGLIPYVQEMQRVIRKTINRRTKSPSTTPPPPPAQALLAAAPSKIDEADLPDNYREILANEGK